MFDAQPRYGRTGKKMITLTHTGREQIQRFANAHGMNFSATIESLALIGMEADVTALLVPLLQEVVNKALQRNSNRLAKLSLLAAAEAAMAHDLATMLLLQFIRREAYADVRPHAFGGTGSCITPYESDFGFAHSLSHLLHLQVCLVPLVDQAPSKLAANYCDAAVTDHL